MAIKFKLTFNLMNTPARPLYMFGEREQWRENETMATVLIVPTTNANSPRSTLNDLQFFVVG